jgi:hypothetical protein
MSGFGDWIRPVLAMIGRKSQSSVTPGKASVLFSGLI